MENTMKMSMDMLVNGHNLIGTIRDLHVISTDGYCFDGIMLTLLRDTLRSLELEDGGVRGETMCTLRGVTIDIYARSVSRECVERGQMEGRRDCDCN